MAQEGLQGFNPGAPVDQQGSAGNVSPDHDESRSLATNPLGLSSSTLDVLGRTEDKRECEKESRTDLIAGVAPSSDSFETPRDTKILDAMRLLDDAKHARRATDVQGHDQLAYSIFHSGVYRNFYITLALVLMMMPLWVPVAYNDPTHYNGEHWRWYLLLEAFIVLFFAVDIALHRSVHGARRFRASRWALIKLTIVSLMVVNIIVNATLAWPIYFVRPFFSLLLVERTKNVRRILENSVIALPRVLFVAIPLLLLLLFTSAVAFLLFRGVDSNCVCSKLGMDTAAGRASFGLGEESCPYSRQYDWDETWAYDFCSVFSQNCRDYFKSLGASIVHLYHMMQTVNNPDVTLPTYACSQWTQTLFQVFLMLGYYFLISLILAIVFSSFQELHAKKAAKLANRRVYALDEAFKLLAVPSHELAHAACEGTDRVNGDTDRGASASTGGGIAGAFARTLPTVTSAVNMARKVALHARADRRHSAERTASQGRDVRHKSYVEIESFRPEGEADGKDSGNSYNQDEVPSVAAPTHAAGAVVEAETKSPVENLAAASEERTSTSDTNSEDRFETLLRLGQRPWVRAVSRSARKLRNRFANKGESEAHNGRQVGAESAASADAHANADAAETGDNILETAYNDRCVGLATLEQLCNRFWKLDEHGPRKVRQEAQLARALFEVLRSSPGMDDHGFGLYQGTGDSIRSLSARQHEDHRNSDLYSGIDRVQFQNILPFLRMRFTSVDSKLTTARASIYGNINGTPLPPLSSASLSAPSAGLSEHAESRCCTQEWVRERVVFSRWFQPGTDILVALSSVLLYWRLTELPACTLDSAGCQEQDAQRHFVLTSHDAWNVGFLILLVIFGLELILNIVAWGFTKFWKESWVHKLDFLVVSIATISYAIAAGGSSSNTWILYAMVLLLRVLRIVRPLSHSKHFRTFARSVSQIVPGLLRYLVAAFAVFYFFAIVGMELFAGRVVHCRQVAAVPGQTNVTNPCADTSYDPSYTVPYGEPCLCAGENIFGSVASLFCLRQGLIIDSSLAQIKASSCSPRVQQSAFATANYWYMHFNTLPSSFVVLFQLTVVNNWPIVEEGHLVGTHTANRLYFIGFWLVMVILVFNLLTSYMLEAFSATYTRNMLQQTKNWQPEHVRELDNMLRKLSAGEQGLKEMELEVVMSNTGTSVLLVDSDAAYDDHHARSLAWVKHYEHEYDIARGRYEKQRQASNDRDQA